MNYSVYTILDADGLPLYVGCSNSPARRLAAHANKSWGKRMATVKLEWFDDDVTAHRRECELIVKLQPLHNIADGGTKARTLPGLRRDQIIAILGRLGEASQTDVEREVGDMGKSTAGVTLARLVETGHAVVKRTEPSTSGRWPERRIYALAESVEQDIEDVA